MLSKLIKMHEEFLSGSKLVQSVDVFQNHMYLNDYCSAYATYSLSVILSSLVK